MKKLLIVIFFSILLFSLAGCGSTRSEQTGGSGVSYSAWCQAFEDNKALSDEVTMSQDQGLSVHLCSNASTGYSWNDADIADTAIIRQLSKEYLEPQTGEDDQPVPGEPGQDVFGFEALQPGTTTMNFSYSRPGEEQAAWTLELTVTVE